MPKTKRKRNKSCWNCRFNALGGSAALGVCKVNKCLPTDIMPAFCDVGCALWRVRGK